MAIIRPNFGHTWADAVKPLEQDDIMAASHAFRANPRQDRLNLSPGVVFDSKGRSFGTEVFRRHLKEIAGQNVGYMDADGNKDYLAAHGREWVFGHELWEEMGGSLSDSRRPENMAWCQTVGSSHALYMVKEILKTKLEPAQQKILIDTGWQNHQTIFEDLDTVNYKHEDPESRTYNHQEYLKLLQEHPQGAPVLLQAAGYNDDGSDRSQEQWEEILGIIIDRRLLPVFDFAYNGLVNGFGQDNFAVKKFTAAGIPCFVCVSNSKNMSYGARLGSLYAVNFGKDQADNLQTYMAYGIVCPNIGNPPRDAAWAAANLLSDEADRSEHLREIDQVTSIISRVRLSLARELGAPWIANKSGLFVKLRTDGLSDEELRSLREDHAIYTPRSSRINLGGIPEDCVSDVANRITQALGQI